MPKFRYYIADIDFAEVYGTNDSDLVKELQQADSLLVIDTETNKFMGEFLTDAGPKDGLDVPDWKDRNDAEDDIDN